MRKIGRGHNVVVAQNLDDLLDPGIILIGGNVALALEIFDRTELKSWDFQSAKATLYTCGKPIQPERYPSGARFQMHHAQLRMAFQYSAHYQCCAGQHIADREGDRGLNVAQSGQVMVEHVFRRRAGTGVDREWYVVFL